MLSLNVYSWQLRQHQIAMNRSLHHLSLNVLSKVVVKSSKLTRRGNSINCQWLFSISSRRHRTTRINLRRRNFVRRSSVVSFRRNLHRLVRRRRWSPRLSQIRLWSRLSIIRPALVPSPSMISMKIRPSSNNRNDCSTISTNRSIKLKPPPLRPLFIHFRSHGTLRFTVNVLYFVVSCRVPYHPDASSHEVTMHDVSRLFSHQIDQEDQLIFATQLCNSILNMQERLEEKTNVLYAVEQAISNELNHVLHQQHYDTLPSTISLTSNDNSNNSSLSNDLISLKNSIYRSRELSRVQSKEMHDLDLSLREMEVLIASKYDELKYLEYETSNGRSLTPSYSSQQQNYRPSVEETSTYETFDLPTLTTTSSAVFTSMKEMDEDSGINSLTSDDSNHHSVLLTHQKLPSQTTQLETLVWVPSFSCLCIFSTSLFFFLTHLCLLDNMYTSNSFSLFVILFCFIFVYSCSLDLTNENTN